MAGREVSAAAAPRQAQVIDLFEALKRSLADRKDKAANEAEAVAKGEGAGDDAAAEGQGDVHPAVAKARERKPRAKKQA